MSRTFDWEAIERDYRAGQLSIRELSRSHGPSDTAIRKRAKRYGWTRNLAESVRSAVRDRLIQEEVRGADIAAAVDAAAERGVTVVRMHRRDIRQAAEIVAGLFAELKDENAHLTDLLATAMDAEKVDKRLLHALSLPSRTSAARQLAGALKDLVTLERRAFNLDEREDEGVQDDQIPLEQRLRSYTEEQAIDDSDNVERFKRKTG